MSIPNKESSIIKEKQYKCSVRGCNAVYKKSCMLEVHIRKHTGERPFVCDFPGCSLSYTNICHLKRHVCLVHEKSCEVLCKEEGCGQVFSNKYALKKHYNNKHNTDPKYNCSKCSRHFKRKKWLQEHICEDNDEEAPFKCPHCKLVFKKFHLYNKHKRNHRTYTCDCGVVFGKWTLFLEHRRVSCDIARIDHKCVICNKIFTTQTNLKVHALIHLEESQLNVHHCPYINCTRSYKYKKNLNFHITTFHEKCDRSLECSKPGCGKVLQSKRGWELHLQRVHGTRPKKKERKPRHDKGKRKKCMASVISGVEIPLSEHSTIISKSSAVQNIMNSSSTSENAQLELDNNESISVRSQNNKQSQKNCESAETKQITSIPIGADPKHNIDDELLEYCDGVLRTLQERLDQLPHRNTQSVY